MRILFLVHRIPYPPNRGDKIRSFNTLRYLAEKHSVSLVCLADTREDLAYISALSRYCKSVDIALINPFWAKLKSLFYLFSSRPLTLSYFFSKKLKRTLNYRLSTLNYDLIYVYSSSMAQYVIDVNNIPKIMDFVDVDSDKWLQYAGYTRAPLSLIYRLEGLRLRRYEASIAEKFNRSIVVSQKEKEIFNSFVGDSRISVIPNGVDFEYFKPSPDGYEPNTLVFTGTMDYFANVDGMLYFYRDIFPLIKKEITNVRVYIVGNKPVKEIRKLALDKDIIVTGFVKNIRPYLNKSAVYIAPLRIARGVQNKILEAMAAGIPVVTTNKALEGIDAVPGEDIIIEDDPRRFAKKTIELLQDRAVRDRFARNGRKMVEAKYSWNSNLERLEEILRDVVKR